MRLLHEVDNTKPADEAALRLSCRNPAVGRADEAMNFCFIATTLGIVLRFEEEFQSFHVQRRSTKSHAQK